MTWRHQLAAPLLLLALLPARASAQEAPQNPCGPVTCAEVVAYMRTLPAETLIELAWSGTGQTARALAIARRESRFGCSADNPLSSAAGLFQTLYIHEPRAARLKLSWANIAGPDCYDDVLLAFDIWKDSGWGPWS